MSATAPVRVRPDDAHNRRWIANVHPPGRRNPEPAGRYNLVVLGAGAAGLVAAVGAAGLGAKVALVERHLLGGDCLNVGCVPSKALLRAARAAAEVRAAGAFGVRVPPGLEVDFGAVMERMRRLRARISEHDSVARLERLGVEVFLGHGRFVAPDALEVDGKRLRFARAVIATGGRPVALPIPGLVEAGYLDNVTVFELTELPRRLAVIGAGPIGCELAQAFRRFGAQVTLIELLPEIMGREDPDAIAIVRAALEREGIEILTRTETKRVETRGRDRVLHLQVAGEPREIACDAILLGVGRAPNVEDLGLEQAGVAFEPRRGVLVDDRLRTTNRRIYAAGDVCSHHRFTHVADAQARLVLRNALFCGRARASALTVPWCTYTDPEVAHVGLTLAEAERRGLGLRTFTERLQGVDRAILDGETEGFVKVHLERGRDRIAGATIVARHAGELIAELSLAMTAGLGLGAIASTIHPYPTQAEAIRRVADAYNRTRLTPRVRWLFAKWFAWRR
ncbi:MAG: mercuric reductase [Planctomycetota bacterium]|nr:MAG: mercuric reductase [Planctomycetota bacterium]